MLAVARASRQPLTLESKTVRNADYVEHTLRAASSGDAIFHGAMCYGFRSLQNVCPARRPPWFHAARNVTPINTPVLCTQPHDAIHVHVCVPFPSPGSTGTCTDYPTCIRRVSVFTYHEHYNSLPEGNTG